MTFDRCGNGGDLSTGSHGVHRDPIQEVDVAELLLLVVRSLETLRPVTPLESDDFDRPRVASSGFRPKQES